MARLLTLALMAGSCAAFAPARSAPAKTFALRETAASAEDVRLVISDVPGKSELDEMTAAKRTQQNTRCETNATQRTKRNEWTQQHRTRRNECATNRTQRTERKETNATR